MPFDRKTITKMIIKCPDMTEALLNERLKVANMELHSNGSPLGPQQFHITRKGFTIGQTNIFLVLNPQVVTGDVAREGIERGASHNFDTLTHDTGHYQWSAEKLLVDEFIPTADKFFNDALADNNDNPYDESQKTPPRKPPKLTPLKNSAQKTGQTSAKSDEQSAPQNSNSDQAGNSLGTSGAQSAGFFNASTPLESAAPPPARESAATPDFDTQHSINGDISHGGL